MKHKYDIHVRPDVTFIDTDTGITSCKPTNVTVEVWGTHNEYMTTVHLHEMIDCWKEHNPLVKK